MRRNAEAEAQRRRLANRRRADDEVLRDLQELGYTPKRHALHLVPLLRRHGPRVAYGKDSTLIIKAARARGVAAGSAATSMTYWLSVRL